jgi:hypothetical protein
MDLGIIVLARSDTGNTTQVLKFYTDDFLNLYKQFKVTTQATGGDFSNLEMVDVHLQTSTLRWEYSNSGGTLSVASGLQIDIEGLYVDSLR